MHFPGQRRSKRFNPETDVYEMVAKFKRRVLATILVVPVIIALAIFRGEVFTRTVDWFVARAHGRTGAITESR